MSALVVRNFDYAMLAPDVASLAAAAAIEIRTLTHRQITEAVAAGKLLLDVKAALPHGARGGVLSAEQRALRDRWAALRIPFGRAQHRGRLQSVRDLGDRDAGEWAMTATIPLAA